MNLYTLGGKYYAYFDIAEPTAVIQPRRAALLPVCAANSHALHLRDASRYVDAYKNVSGGLDGIDKAIDIVTENTQLDESVYLKSKSKQPVELYPRQRSSHGIQTSNRFILHQTNQRFLSIYTQDVGCGHRI